MEGNLILLNYDDVKCDTGVPLSEIASIVITVVSGDEIAEVTMNTGEHMRFDSADLSGDSRCQESYDRTYLVDMNNLEKWVNRRNSYDWSNRERAAYEMKLNTAKGRRMVRWMI